MALFLYITMAIIAALSAYIYLYGIPPQLKRRLEEEALEKMGENKASYMTKSMVGQIPDSDQKQFNQVKEGVSDVGGGALQNEGGKFAGNLADDATADLTGRRS